MGDFTNVTWYNDDTFSKQLNLLCTKPKLHKTLFLTKNVFWSRPWIKPLSVLHNNNLLYPQTIRLSKMSSSKQDIQISSLLFIHHLYVTSYCNLHMQAKKLFYISLYRMWVFLKGHRLDSLPRRVLLKESATIILDWHKSKSFCKLLAISGERNL